MQNVWVNFSCQTDRTQSPSANFGRRRLAAWEITVQMAKRSRLVPKSVTLNDLERRNRLNGCVISPISLAFWADYVKVVENTRILSAAEM